MQKTYKMLLFVAVLITVVATIPATYAGSLNITVETSKSSYQVSEDITIHGNLTYDGSPVPDNSVGLQVKDPVDDVVVSRTLQTNASGVYNLTFKLPADAKNGTYTVYVSSTYMAQTATNNTTFEYGVAPMPVGGIWIPVDKLSLLAPYIVLAAAIILAIAVTAVFFKHGKKQKVDLRARLWT